MPPGLIHDFRASTCFLGLNEFGRQRGDWLQQLQPARADRTIPPAQDIRDEDVERVRIERGNFDFPTDHVMRRELFERVGLFAKCIRRRSPVTPKKDLNGFRIERGRLGRISQNKLIAVDPSVGMQPRRKFDADLRVGVQCRRDSVRGPTLEKSFPLSHPGQRSHFQTAKFSFNYAPAFRSKFAQRIVFRANPLQIQEQVPLTSPVFFPAGRKRAAGLRGLLQQAFAEAFGNEDKIRRQEDFGGCEKRLARDAKFALQRVRETCFRPCQFGGAFPADSERARGRVCRRRHGARPNRLAPCAKKLLGKSGAVPGREMFDL